MSTAAESTVPDDGGLEPGGSGSGSFSVQETLATNKAPKMQDKGNAFSRLFAFIDKFILLMSDVFYVR